MTRASATELPAGFEESIVVEAAFPQNFAQFAFAPDGRLLLGDKYGLVTVFAPDDVGAYVPEAVVQVAVDATGERGINGLAADPDFETNRHVWIYYTTQAPARNRLSRFTFAGGTLTDETVVVEGPLVESADHNGGCVRFASDKTLFVATGDDHQGSVTAQDPFDLRGKVLHLNRDGTPAAGNPYLDGAGGDPRVWARGFRNPYRISIQPGTDNVFIADVGNAQWEELNVGIAGGNFGWAQVEGPVPAGVPAMIYPILSIEHLGGGSAIIGGDHAPPEFAPDYEGNYFYSDFVQRTLWRVVLDDANTPAGAELFATDFGHATDIQFGPGGALYYVCRSCAPASLRKIEHVSGANRQPVARATASPHSGPAPLQVQLDGSGSSDADEDPLSYDWDLGDGGQSGQVALAHTYAEGVYHASLTVQDGQGGEDSAVPLRIVAGNSSPLLTISSPSDESTYDAGQLVLYTGFAADDEDGQVPCSAVTWQVLLHHGIHTHPFLGPIQGSCVGAFATPLGGERAPDQWYEIRMTAEDSGQPLGPAAALRASRSIEIRPNLSAMTFQTLPVPGLTLTLDTAPFQSPQTTLGVVNASRTIGTLDFQIAPDGQPYRFVDWSDGGAIEHTISTPAADTVYSAQFGCAAPEVRNLMINPGAGNQLDMTWDELPEGCVVSGPGRYRIYAATHYRPAADSGQFPDDPQYRLIGTSATGQLSPEKSLRDVYFLVVGAGPDGLDGVVGHYGF